MISTTAFRSPAAATRSIACWSPRPCARRTGWWPANCSRKKRARSINSGGAPRRVHRFKALVHLVSPCREQATQEEVVPHVRLGRASRRDAQHQGGDEADDRLQLHRFLRDAKAAPLRAWGWR